MTGLTTSELIIDIPGRPSGQPLNLRVEPGQVWGVLGPNGVGKTTLLHTLAGLRQPRAGQVLLDEQPVTGMKRKQLARRLGWCFRIARMVSRQRSWKRR
nr:ATP-binding cassette domain-containing protein [Marinobacter similis]